MIASAFAALALARPAAADPLPAAPPNAIQLDLGLAVVGVAYERMITPRLAVQIEGQLFRTWFMDPDLEGVGAEIRPTYFFGARPPQGIYAAIYGRADRVSTTIDGEEGDGTAWSIGQFVGWSQVFAGRFNARIGAGVQVLGYRIDLAEDADDTRVLPALDLVVGWHF